MVKLRSNDLLQLRLPLPSFEEQKMIAARVSSQRASLEGAIAAVNRQIALLRERRQALITAAVAGGLQMPQRSPARAAA